MTASSRGRRPYNISVLQCGLSLPKLFARAARGLTASGTSSLSITGPAVRIPYARLRQSAPLVQTAGLKISQELGYRTKAGVAGRIERAGPKVQPLPAAQMRRAAVAR